MIWLLFIINLVLLRLSAHDPAEYEHLHPTHQGTRTTDEYGYYSESDEELLEEEEEEKENDEPDSSTSLTEYKKPKDSPAEDRGWGYQQ